MPRSGPDPTSFTLTHEAGPREGRFSRPSAPVIVCSFVAESHPHPDRTFIFQSLSVKIHLLEQRAARGSVWPWRARAGGCASRVLELFTPS